MKHNCEHDFYPTELMPHPNDAELKIVVLVCRKCFGHMIRFSKELE